MTAPRLLVVDDETEFADYVASVAEGLGYDVRVINRPTEFEAVYKAFDPTHIVLDIVMPEMDGVEIVRWLVSQGCTSKLIVASGYNPRYAKMASLIGADRGIKSIATLTKPVSLADLRAALA